MRETLQYRSSVGPELPAAPPLFQTYPSFWNVGGGAVQNQSNYGSGISKKTGLAQNELPIAHATSRGIVLNIDIFIYFLFFAKTNISAYMSTSALTHVYLGRHLKPVNNWA